MSLRKALLVDLDGTLFNLGDRSPYDVSQCGLDTVNAAVHQVMLWAAKDGWGIVLGSGRGFHEKDRYYTEQALLWQGIQYDQLSMRKPGDDRKDHVVKRELYLEEIKPRWAVGLVLDDRKTVVDMWRHSLQLDTFQVDDRLDHEANSETVRLRAEVERLERLVAAHHRVELRLAREVQEALAASDGKPRGREGTDHG